MTTLEVEDDFDVHEYRSSLKLLRQDGGSMTLANRGELQCPACEQSFDRLFVSEDATVTFSSAPGGPICLVRTGSQLVVLTH